MSYSYRIDILQEEPSQFAGDGSLQGKRYFHCAPGRGFFTKHRSLKTDKRFTSIAAPDGMLSDVADIVHSNFIYVCFFTWGKVLVSLIFVS